MKTVADYQKTRERLKETLVRLKKRNAADFDSIVDFLEMEQFNSLGISNENEITSAMAIAQVTRAGTFRELAESFLKNSNE